MASHVTVTVEIDGTKFSTAVTFGSSGYNGGIASIFAGWVYDTIDNDFNPGPK